MQQREILRRLATARQHAVLVTQQIEELERLYRQAADADGVPAIVQTLQELEHCRWILSVLHFSIATDNEAPPIDSAQA